jgi:DHA2 family multidrug resistance protein
VDKPGLASEEKRPKRPPVALVIAVVLTAVLEVLDITIVTVATPHMLAAFGATPDQINWVLTSYLVSAAVVMPLTGFLSDRLGRRRLLFLSITGFIASSALCGMASTLGIMVLFRLTQGLCGAPLVPLSQAILLDAFPREKHGQALAIFGFGIMVAPVLGPTLGGILTDSFSWRAVFYVNVPIGMLALILAIGHLPYLPLKPLKIDWMGLFLLVLSVGSLQFVLDQGQLRDWFSSGVIQVFSGITLFSGAAFFMRGWDRSDNIVNLSLLKDRNFVLGLVAIAAYGITLFGSLALLPLLTQSLLGYPAMAAGLLFIPRATVSAISLAVTGSLLLGLFDARYLVAAGVVLSAIGTMLMAGFSLEVDAWGLIWPGLIAGAGMGLFFVPLTSVAFGDVPSNKLDEAAGLYALMRGIGSSMGIAVVSWLFVRQGQVHWQILAGHVTSFNPPTLSYQSAFGINHWSDSALAFIAREIARQAQMQAFNDLFWLIGWITLAILPLLLLGRRPQRKDLVMA